MADVPKYHSEITLPPEVTPGSGLPEGYSLAISTFPDTGTFTDQPFIADAADLPPASAMITSPNVVTPPSFVDQQTDIQPSPLTPSPVEGVVVDRDTRNSLVEDLYTQHYDSLTKYAARLACGFQYFYDTEVVVQEAMVNIIRALDAGRIRDISRLPGIAYAAVSNLIKTGYRHDKVMIDYHDRSFDRDGLTSPSAEQDATRNLEVSSVLEQATEARRPILVMVAMGYTYEEIANFYGITAGAVKSTMARIRNNAKDPLPANGLKPHRVHTLSADDLKRIEQIESGVREGIISTGGLGSAFERLTPVQQKVWGLFAKGLSRREISGEAGMSYSTVCEQLQKARKSLLASLAEQTRTNERTL